MNYALRVMTDIKKHKTKKTEISMTALLLLGILVVVNFLSYQIFFRWDLTQNKIYSISDVSKKTVGGLDDVVNIKAYFSKNLPGQLFSLKQEVKDMLDEYQNYSNGKIKVEYIDPNDDEETKRELYMIGIPQLQFEVYEKDKRALVNGYMGIAINYGDNTETIPAVKQDTSDLEYQLTTAIKKVTSDEIATIGVLSSNGSASLEKDLSSANKELSALYDVLPVDLSGEEAQVPSQVKTLIIPAPKEKFTEAQTDALKKFVDQGGSVLALVDGVSIGEGLSATKNDLGLNKFFNEYGITLNNDLVGDTRSGVASFSQGFFTFSSNYAFWPKITSEGFNQNYNAVANLESVILPWASSISINKDKISEDNIMVLANTTDKAWKVEDNFNVSPKSANTPQGTRQKYNLAVSAKINDTSGITVVGDGDFMNNNFIQGNPDNLTFFQNLVDSLSLDDDLINIRSKVVSSRPIKELTDSEKMLYRYLNVFGVTILIVFYGMFRYFMRRKSRFTDDL